MHNYKDNNMEPQDIILSKAVDVQMNHVIKYEIMMVVITFNLKWLIMGTLNI